MKKVVKSGCLALSLLSLIYTAGAATNASSSVNAGGQSCSNANYQSFVSIGQGTPISHSDSPNAYHYGGFLNTFVDRPGSDADGDGIADENDLDDDGDGLRDDAELSGANFSPQTATDPLVSDTDSDGMSDRKEAIAGTNPKDASSLLQLSIAPSTSEVRDIRWVGRAERDYTLYSSDSVTGLVTSPVELHSVSPTSGSGPWQETNVTVTVTNPASRTFYRLKVE